MAGVAPVCTTEPGRTAGPSDEFAARNAKPIAVSVDSIEDRHRWLPDISEVAGVPVDEVRPYLRFADAPA